MVSYCTSNKLILSTIDLLIQLLAYVDCLGQKAAGGTLQVFLPPAKSVNPPI